MEENQRELENLLKEARITDSKTLVVNEEFKNSLREQLYQRYLSEIGRGESIMKRLSSLVSSKFALLSLGALFVVVLAGGGVYMYMRRSSEQKQGVVLLAANLALTDGEVEIRRGGEDMWIEGLQGDMLSQGDSLRTASESRAVLELDDGNALRLNSSSEVKLVSMDPEAVVMEQVSGESYSRVADSEENTYTVKGQGVEAIALGTAYIFTSDNEKNQVKVYVYESEVKVKIKGDEEDVEELKKAIVNTIKNTIEIEDMKEKEYKSEFAEWNKAEDEEMGYKCHETNRPVVKITIPEDGVETDKDVITVKGTVTDESTLKKIVVNGEIYTQMKDSKGFDPKTGQFNVNVALDEGENVIKVKAYDIYWNASKQATVTVTRTVSDPMRLFYVSSVSSPGAGKIYVKWGMSGYSATNGFQAVASKERIPVYPGDESAYVSDGSAREAYITNLSAGTYKVRVCIYNGSGECSMYTSNYHTVTVSGDVMGEYATQISLTARALGGGKVSLNWSISGGGAPNGFKVVWAKYENPTLDNCEDVSYQGEDSRSYTVSGLTTGKTYHFRVGLYKIGGGSCVLYSNDAEVYVT